MMRYFWAIVMLIAAVCCFYGFPRGDFWPLLLAYSAWFAAYVWVAKAGKNLAFWLAMAVLLRLLLLWGAPNLSDDIYRYLWDGYLLWAGEHPFLQLPADYVAQGFYPAGTSPELYEQLNSPHYYSVYPPVAQAFFALAAWPEEPLWGMFVLRLAFVAMELGTLYFMCRLLLAWNLAPQRLLWYALNPLIILELTGNLHLELGLAFFTTLALWATWRWAQGAGRGYYALAALAWALGIGMKLLPLLFLPFLWSRLGAKKALQLWAATALFLLLLFSPLLQAQVLAHFGESLDLYFQKFEFNSGLYYLLRALGQWITGYNLIGIIGPLLSLGVAFWILRSAFYEKRRDWESFPEQCLWAIALYYLCSTTVHPWYLTGLLIWLPFSQWRFPMLWSGLVFLSYHNYLGGSYYEDLRFIALEYLLLALFLVLEWRQRSAKGHYLPFGK